MRMGTGKALKVSLDSLTKQQRCRLLVLLLWWSAWKVFRPCVHMVSAQSRCATVVLILICVPTIYVCVFLTAACYYLVMFWPQHCCYRLAAFAMKGYLEL